MILKSFEVVVPKNQGFAAENGLKTKAREKE
jgi:hypothetical protein